MLPHDLTVAVLIPQRVSRDEGRLRDLLKPRSKRVETFVDEGTVAVPESWRWTKGAYRQWAAVKAAIRAAKDEGAESVLLVEDDCVLADDFDEKAAAFHKGEARWDLLYYGGDLSIARAKPLGQGVVGDRILLAHCLAVRSTVYDTILEADPAYPFDVDLVRLVQSDRRRRAACLPGAAWSRPGYSHVYEQIVDYSKLKRTNGQEAKPDRRRHPRGGSPRATPSSATA